MLDQRLVRDLAAEFLGDLFSRETFTTQDLIQYVRDNYDGPDADETIAAGTEFNLDRTARWVQQTWKKDGLIERTEARGVWVHV